MRSISLDDLKTYPAIGSWAWGDLGIPYQVVKRLKESGQFWLIVATPVCTLHTLATATLASKRENKEALRHVDQ
ncbi:hypothetical protein DO97_00985 [Neosynechococcus sphagnicola sy1]|uniref:Uncharacterized protein n=1 Tax=Neosynechococcus sphagnicola sy1 TaxID=1497020 RepID=A0A098TH38_9CYAN|nr:hypothetical protein DO97_00985 [Neosynechococcus sphagnicola sy1]